MKHFVLPIDITIGDLIELSPFERWSCKIRDDYSKKSRSFETGGGWFLVVDLYIWSRSPEIRFTLSNIHTLRWEYLSLKEQLDRYDPQIINHVKG